MPSVRPSRARRLPPALPADENIWFHPQAASVAHTTAHYINFFNLERTRKSLFQFSESPSALGHHVRPEIALDMTALPQRIQAPMRVAPTQIHTEADHLRTLLPHPI